MDGTNNLGTIRLVTTRSGASASLTTNKLAVGTHRITVVYNGDALDLKSKSSVLNVLVKPIAK
jgi:hypothetical protein